MTMRPVLAAALATVCLFALFEFSGSIGSRKINLFPATDFGLFYCAGRALESRANPYVMEPLRTCEKQIDPSGLPATVAEPAPLPGYALAFFALLAWLPFAAAKVIWLLIECAALVGSTMLLARLTRLPTAAIFVALFLADAVMSITWGQLPPIAIAGLVAAAYFLRRQRTIPAAIAAAVALIEPHLGLPAVLAILIWVPRARVALTVALALLGATHFIALGGEWGVRYFSVVLPGMALSEVHAADQLSFTWLMHYLGASDSVALRLGSITYALMLVVGIAIAGRLAARRNDPALLAVLPPAIALLGGPYVHQIQIAAALPAALVLGAASRGRTRVLLFVAVAALAVPWFSILDSWALLLCGALAVLLFLAFALSGVRLVSRLGYGVLAALVCCALLVGLRYLPNDARGQHVAPLVAPTARASLASVSWGDYLRSDRALSSLAPRVVAAKLPTWGALLLLLLVSGFSAAGYERRPSKVAAPA